MSAQNELMFEPRALWDVQSVDTFDFPNFINDAGEQSTKIRVAFEREHFRNGSRNPITISKVCFGAIGYVMREWDGFAAPPNAGSYDSCTSVLEKIQFLVTAPMRQHFSFRPGLSAALSTLPIDDISMRNDPNFPYSSGMLGVTKWKFDKKMVIPRGAIAEFQLGVPVLLSDLEASPPACTFEIGFFEGSGLPGGSARTKRDTLLYFDDAAAASYPFQPPDGTDIGNGNTTAIYPPAQHFTPDEWRAQQGTDAGSTGVDGFAVAIDQIALDDALNALGAPFAGFPVAPLAMRTPVGRARLNGAGSGDDWWRPDIPLGLLGATLGPAQVVELQRPITLHPGDCLDVEMMVPAAVTLPASPPQTTYPIYQIGVSFLGTAAIAG